MSPKSIIFFSYLAFLSFVISPVTGLGQTVIDRHSPLIVTADQPNVWTLEQAHYLIAQLHRRNLSLKAEQLDELDPNQINAVNLDALKTILSISAEFDQSVGKNNSELTRNRQQQSTELNSLINRRNDLEGQSLSLVRQIAELKIQKIHAKTEEEKLALQNQIEEMEVVKAAINEQITLTNNRIDANSKVTGELKSVTVTEPTPAPSPEFSNIFTDTAKTIVKGFSESPQLNASLRLENYIQMQYEILAKQLTLLRSEVGAGERLLFLEIPQSIRSSYDEADDKWAQTWWNLSGYRHCIVYREVKAVDGKSLETTVPCSTVFDGANADGRKLTSAQITDGRNQDIGAQISDYRESLKLTRADLEGLRLLDKRTFSSLSQLGFEFKVEENAFTESNKDLSKCWRENTVNGKTDYSACSDYSDRSRQIEDDLREKILVSLDDFVSGRSALTAANLRKQSTRLEVISRKIPSDDPLYRRVALNEFLGLPIPMSAVQAKRSLTDGDRSLRIVDLFPRQSSLNVNDMKIRSRATSIKGIFQLLSGFGASVGYQQTRERYSQFVQQELYSSGFGKGSREFGWTFNPMPGTNRVASGVRTTYAIVVVPEDTTSIILESSGCYFQKRKPQPINFADLREAYWTARSRSHGCFPSKTFEVSVPDGGSMYNNEYFVTGLTFNPVPVGARAVVTVYGRDFSSQMGVLINGEPLEPALGLGQPFILDDRTATAGDKTNGSVAPKEPSTSQSLNGRFERIGSNQIILSFKMPTDFEGTPTITLISPRKTVDLNDLPNLRINSSFSKLSESPFIFGKKPEIRTGDVKIASLAAFVHDEKIKILITGSNLKSVKKAYVDGVEIAIPGDASNFLLVLKDIKPSKSTSSEISIILETQDGVIGPRAVIKPSAEKPK